MNKISDLVSTGNWLATLCPPGYMSESGMRKPHPAFAAWERAVAAHATEQDRIIRVVGELVGAALDTLATGVPAAHLDSAVDAVVAALAIVPGPAHGGEGT